MIRRQSEIHKNKLLCREKDAEDAQEVGRWSEHSLASPLYYLTFINSGPSQVWGSEVYPWCVREDEALTDLNAVFMS